ncbi:MAG: MBL fold metallo-hydrolase [Thermodesulfobacteriota bacterium]
MNAWHGPGRGGFFPNNIAMLFACLALAGFLASCTHGAEPGGFAGGRARVSDHFDGRLFFNPTLQGPASPPAAETPGRGRSRWIWRLLLGNDWPEWPQPAALAPGAPPAARVPTGALTITPVGHSTFLIQLDGLNILTDPIWSERCSPVAWAGPKRFQAPGLRFEDLPAIDAVLVTHNHYDHLDLPTLERLAGKGVQRAVTTLGNRGLIRETGIPAVDELDWWQSLRLSETVTVTLVPARHFSSRTLWDRNETLWGGFVISGPAGNIYYSGDTGYGPHFREIARRFSPVRAAILPISPFRPRQPGEPAQRNFAGVHMGPAEAVQAHLDLGAGLSIAAHFQVFQLGGDGFDDAPKELELVLRERGLKPDAFITPALGRPIDAAARPDDRNGPAGRQRADAKD